MTEQKQAVAKANGKNRLIRDHLESPEFKKAVETALPTHLKPDRFIRVALTAMTRTPKLANCDKASFFSALLTLSQLGIEPDGRRAHLIPFENSKRNCTEVQLIIDYKGLVELAMRSGIVSYIHADVVCENDGFQYDRGEIKFHTIDFKKDRGDVYAVYALCRFKDGTEKCEVMGKAEVEKVRQRSRARNAGPWVTDWPEMAKKTAFRRLSKWLPLSPEFRDALDADADQLEEQRFETAKPVFSAADFNLPSGEAPAALPNSTANDDGYLPADDTPEETKVPIRKKQEAKPEPKASEEDIPATAQLERLVYGADHDFETFRQWGLETGNLPEEAQKWDSFCDVPEGTCERFLKASKGLLLSLDAVKGEKK